jgi:hypothetical protein
MRGRLSLFFPSAGPMVLYHVAHKNRLAKIRREGLKPHRPGDVWGSASPEMTRGRSCVWLTADSREWRHDRHPDRKFRNPKTRLLTVAIGWDSKKLHHYLSWFDPDKHGEAFLYRQNVPAWFVHFGKIAPEAVIDGLK